MFLKAKIVYDIIVYLKFFQENMTSKSTKIFGLQSRGIGTTQGRNAQLPMSMQKKPDAMNDLPLTERYEISPFSGYNAPTYENTLVQSQVSDPFLNQQSIRKVIRQQMQKQGFSKSKNDISIIRTEIKSLKDYVREMGEKLDLSNSQYEELKEGIQEMMSKIIEDYKIDSAKNLREVVKKINQNVRKECLSHLSQEYVPIEFVDDVEQKILEIQDRITLIQTKNDGSRSKIHEDPIVLAETVDLRLKKIEREIQSIKKQTTENSNKSKEVDTNIQGIQKKFDDFQQNRQQDSKFLHKLKQESIIFDKDLKKIFTNIQEFRQENSSIKQKLKQTNQELSMYGGIFESIKKIKGSGNLSQVKDFLMNSKNLVESVEYVRDESFSGKEQRDSLVVVGSNQLENHMLTSSPENQRNKFLSPERPNSPTQKYIINSPQHRVLERVASSNMKSPTQVLEATETKQGSPESKVQAEEAAVEYRIDHQNRLLDSNNSYILDSDNKIVTLSSEQIQLLRNSNLVQLQE